MRAAITIGIAAGLLGLAAGCADAHLRGDDAGGPRDSAPVFPDAAPIDDAAPPIDCRPGDPPPADGTYCLSVGPTHICGDAASQQVCVEGHWQCPDGTSRNPECWCSALEVVPSTCTCTPSGWSCPTDPVDGGLATAPTCPTDLAAAIGTPCSAEGQSCGTCTDPCGGFCNQITCVGGAWQTIELGCADTTFACGPSAWCNRWSEYCERVLSDVAGVPDDYHCAPFPADCADDCTCFPDAPGSGSCTSDATGAVTVTLGGG